MECIHWKVYSGILFSDKKEQVILIHVTNVDEKKKRKKNVDEL